MSKYRSVYDKHGKAYEFTNGELTWVREDLRDRGADGLHHTGSHAVLGDIPDFVSPIDGSVVRGRAGMREHCLRHNVVPTSDLAGLPLKTMNQEHKSDSAYREATKRTIAEIMNSRTYN